MPIHDRATSRLDDRYYVKVIWRGQTIWATIEQQGPFARFAACTTALLADAFTYAELDHVKTTMKGMFHGSSTYVIKTTNDMLTNKQLRLINAG